MKSVKLLIISLLVTTILVGCNQDKDIANSNNKAIAQFTSSMNSSSNMPPGSTWVNNDEIGIYMKKNKTSALVEVLEDNVKYIYNEGNFSTETPIYFPTLESVDFIAYSPYAMEKDKISTDYQYKIDVSSQDDFSKIDLLYSNNATNKNKNTTSVELNFDHKLSRIILNIKAGSNVEEELKEVTVKFEGMPTTVDFSLADGSFSEEGTILPITANEIFFASESEIIYAAIIIPQTAKNWNNRKIVFTFGKTNYEYIIPDNDDFVSGNTYTYDIIVNNKNISVTQSNIMKWVGTTDNIEDLDEATIISIPETVKIPKGTFTMGSPENEGGHNYDETQHKVTIKNDFYMGKTPVTFIQYDAFCLATNRDKISDHGRGRGKNPVIYVKWTDAMAYCSWLSEQTNQVWTLPTENQWEYACRAGTESVFSYGNSPEYNRGEEYMWYNKNSDNTIHPVGSKKPNNWGLYDMHGNVREWCLDKYTVLYDTESAEIDQRIVRGGSYDSDGMECRSASRDKKHPGSVSDDIGFRVVRVL